MMARILNWLNVRLDRLNRRLEERNARKARRVQEQLDELRGRRSR